ncbi:nitroreductase family protein [Sphingomonas sp. H39-1-10]|uniref:nitroreductase family protein n=1 Tax=Sphingomonas pollutisoli TaxID=3030829 RepID=UPI0023B982CE|nr:nitroreductase family protein [Sphingomonas pollutisoli]MDF0489304.1 nitroreductase family protein [Sphingomonas pollutisoli]
MELMEAIRRRRAVREYTDEPVAEDQLRALIGAAVQAPSAMNQQCWSFCVVRDAALLAQISDEAKTYMLRTTPAGLIPHHLEEMLGAASFHIFYHAPAMIVISATMVGAWAPIDCTLAAENLMLAACDAGLGSCWIGFAQGWLGTPEGKAALGLPDDYTPIAPIIVGHPKAEPPVVPRGDPEIRWA